MSDGLVFYLMLIPKPACFVQHGQGGVANGEAGDAVIAGVVFSLIRTMVIIEQFILSK